MNGGTGARRMVVTGAAGFIGSHLAERLLADGHTVVGIDSFEDYYPRAYKEANIARAAASGRFTLVEDNLLRMAGGGADGVRLDEVVAGADCVFHLAAQAGVRASWGQSFRIYTDNNVLATQMVLEACRREGVPRVVYASSSSVYGDTDRLPMHEDANCRPVSPYGVTKLAGEQLCRLYWKNHGVPTVSLRFFTVYGPRQRPDMAFHLFLRALHEGRPLEMYGTGSQTRDFTFVDDIVDGIVRAVDGVDGAVYNLGGGSASRCWRRSARSSASPASRPRCAGRTCRPVTCSTPGPTSHGRATSSATRRRWRSSRACGARRSGIGRSRQRRPGSRGVRGRRSDPG